MKNKKKVIIITAIIVLLIIIAVVSLLIVKNILNNNKKITNEYFEYNDDLIVEQLEIDNKINEYINNNKYSFNNPKIIINPYKISPLSALMIFKTNDEVSYEVYINNNMVTKTEKSKEHIIPIIGLSANNENIIKLSGDNNKSKEYKIKTNEELPNMEIQISNSNLNNEYYFVTNPYNFGYAAYNKDGKAIWYIKKNNATDLKILSNNHYLISGQTNDKGTTSLYEIDALGKIYKSYKLDNETNHIQELSNNSFIYDSYINNDYKNNVILYIYDGNDEELKKYINLYDVFYNVDPSFIKNLDFFSTDLNSFYYDENTNELIVSLKYFDTLASINYETKKINWMISDYNWSDNFSKYLLKTSNLRIPSKISSIYKIDDNNIAILNNDFKIKDMKYSLKLLKDNYSTANIININRTSKTYDTKFEYIDEDKVFNYNYSSLIIKDNNKLIDFGWSFDKDKYEIDGYNYANEKDAYSRLVELDENDNIIFRARLNMPTISLQRSSFYNDITNNYKIEKVKTINNSLYKTPKKINTDEIKDELKNAKDLVGYNVEVTNNNISLKYIFNGNDYSKILGNLTDISYDINIILVGTNNESYIISYSPKDKEPLINPNLKLNGEYNVYLIIDDVYYNANTVANLTYIINGDK